MKRMFTGVLLFAFTAIFACGSGQDVKSPTAPTIDAGPAPPPVLVIVSDGGAPAADAEAPPPLTVDDAGSPTIIVVDGADAPDLPGGGYTMPKCASTCSHLRSMKCSDGTQRKGEDSCYVVCKRAEGSGKIDFKLDCVNKAKTIAEVRACKSYRCL